MQNIKLHPDVLYHIFNRGNNGTTIFRESRNYTYFLQLYAKYILPIADTFAYCLLPNHFHFLLRIKDETTLSHTLRVADTVRQTSQVFANFFTAYAKSFNSTYGRTGSLFENPFHRKPVQTDGNFYRLVIYIHQNPQRHGIVEDFRTWPYSSYQALSVGGKTRLDRKTVLDWFGTPQNFEHLHADHLILPDPDHDFLT